MRMHSFLRLCWVALAVVLLPLQAGRGVAWAATFEAAAIMEGTINDGGFYTQAYMALQHLKKQYGAKVTYTELVKLSDAERVVRRYATTGTNLIFGHAGVYGETMLKVAPDFPKVSFTLLRGGPIKDKPPNVWHLLSLYNEPYYLAGVAAALATKSNKLGYIGGLPVASYIAAYNGFELGANSVNPKVDVLVTYLGTYNDALKAREAAKAHIEAGVDIITHNLDIGVFGLLEAIAGTKTRLIGMGLDQNYLAPGKFVTSVIIDYVKNYDAIAQKVMKGELGGVYMVTYKAGALRLAPSYGNLTPEQEERIERLGRDIESGKLEVPLIYTRREK